MITLLDMIYFGFLNRLQVKDPHTNFPQLVRIPIVINIELCTDQVYRRTHGHHADNHHPSINAEWFGGKGICFAASCCHCVLPLFLCAGVIVFESFDHKTRRPFYVKTVVNITDALV